MSRLIDMLTRTSRAAPAPLGFRAGHVAPEKRRPRLVAAVEAGAAGVAGLTGGADAAVVTVSRLEEAEATLNTLAEAAPGIVWGIRLAGPARPGLADALKLPVDFVVFPPEGTPLALPPEKGPALVLQVAADLKDSLLRALGDIPVDAVLVTAGVAGSPLTWQDLLLVQRAASAVRRPVIAGIPAGAGPGVPAARASPPSPGTAQAAGRRWSSAGSRGWWWG